MREILLQEVGIKHKAWIFVCQECDHEEGPFPNETLAFSAATAHNRDHHDLAREEPGTQSDAPESANATSDVRQRIPIVQGSPDASRESSQLRFMDELFEVMLDHRWEMFTLGEMQLLEDALYAWINAQPLVERGTAETQRKLLHQIADAADDRDLTRDPR
jgi:hypothetical protein